MTTEHIELHRAKFEELELSKGNPIHHDQINEGRYFCEYQHNRWVGYLMHADNLEVTLPVPEIVFDERDIPYTYYDVTTVISFIKSQGIKIKSSEPAKPDKKARCYCGRTEIEGARGMCSDEECIPY